MKVESDISKDFVACYDEARGFAINKKKIIKKRKAKSLSYMEINIIIFISLFVIGVCLIGGCYITCSNNYYLIPLFVIFLSLACFIFSVLNIVYSYLYLRKNKFKNTIKLDKNGITDESFMGIKMTFNWDKVLGVVIGKYTVTILTDTPCYFYFKIDDKRKIIKVLEKYGEEDKIIRKR